MRQSAGIALVAALFLATSAYTQSVSWTYEYHGGVELQNKTGSPASVTLDTYIGDQAICGTTLSCYFHSTPASSLTVGAGAKDTVTVVTWENIFDDGGVHDADFQAEYLYVTSNRAMNCLNGTNDFITTEHNPGSAVNTGSGDVPEWTTHQGGSSGMNCDNSSVLSNTATQVESGNAGSCNLDSTFCPSRSTESGSFAKMHGKALPALDFSVCKVPKSQHPKAWRSSEDMLSGDTTRMVDACPAAFD